MSTVDNTREGLIPNVGVSPELQELYDEFDNTPKRYRNLEEDKNTDVWEECSELTIPYVFPRDDISDTTQLPTPYNSTGASAVNALTAKLLLALLPPNASFFRLLPRKELVEGIEPQQVTMLNEELSSIEQQLIELIATKGLRVQIFEALKYLVVTGNALIMYHPKEKRFRVFSPKSFVIKRDPIGSVLEIIIKEKVDVVTLPDDVRTKIEANKEDLLVVDSEKTKTVSLYTRVVRTKQKTFKVWQEVEGVIAVPPKEYKRKNLPFIPLRWTSIAGEDYGRGMVEQYIGDLRSLEGLTQTIVEGAGIAAQHLFGVRPGSPIRVEDLNNAKNGEFIMGDLEKDITVLQVNKGVDLSVPMNTVQNITARLSQVFLMLSGNIRDSERTTAVEVRATINELETSLGGVYSVLAAELQQPLVTLLINEIDSDVLKVSDVSITTGLSAISRERDFQNLNTMVQSIAQMGPEVLQRYLNLSEYFARIAVSLGMDAKGLVKSPEEIAAEQQAAMQQQALLQQQQMEQQAALQQQKQQGER